MRWCGSTGTGSPGAASPIAYAPAGGRWSSTRPTSTPKYSGPEKPARAGFSEPSASRAAPPANSRRGGPWRTGRAWRRPARGTSRPTTVLRASLLHRSAGKPAAAAVPGWVGGAPVPYTRGRRRAARTGPPELGWIPTFSPPWRPEGRPRGALPPGVNTPGRATAARPA